MYTDSDSSSSFPRQRAAKRKAGAEPERVAVLEARKIRNKESAARSRQKCVLPYRVLLWAVMGAARLGEAAAAHVPPTLPSTCHAFGRLVGGCETPAPPSPSPRVPLRMCCASPLMSFPLVCMCLRGAG